MGDMFSCGDTVWYYPVIGRSARSLHRIDALSVEHGREVAWLEGKSGYVLRTHLFYPTEHEVAERKVIETARRCVVVNPIAPPDRIARSWLELRHAVLALEALLGGDDE